MTLELTQAQAGLYLADLAEVLTALSETLAAVARLAAHTPAGAPPNAMCEALVSSWESLNTRFEVCYRELYGNYPSDDEPTYSARAEARVGPQELQ